MPPDVRDWLPHNHPAWFVIDAVAVVDLDAFYSAYRADGHGRAIERACVEDVACRLIAAQQRPDHATIARFVGRHEHALAGLLPEPVGERQRRHQHQPEAAAGTVQPRPRDGRGSEPGSC